MVNWEAVQLKDIAGNHGKVFNNSTKWLVLFHGPPLRAKLTPPNESTASITYDVIVLYEIDCAYNMLPLYEYPDTLRPFHPEQVTSTDSTNRRPSASNR
jgi:hypothetical protein